MCPSWKGYHGGHIPGFAHARGCRGPSGVLFRYCGNSMRGDVQGQVLQPLRGAGLWHFDGRWQHGGVGKFVSCTSPDAEFAHPTLTLLN